MLRGKTSTLPIENFAAECAKGCRPKRTFQRGCQLFTCSLLRRSSERPLLIDLTRSSGRPWTAAICAQRTTGVDVKLIFYTCDPSTLRKPLISLDLVGRMRKNVVLRFS